uniref:Uncharacterized protein n=1 Tax=Rhizophora mucronata TaxID=61149 RepID=A0A2P2PS31_RHIMU
MNAILIPEGRVSSYMKFWFLDSGC